jgi:hypothetical protein
MKLLLPFLLFSFLSFRSISQDSTITLSKFEIFTSQPNKLMKTEIRETVSIGSTLLSRVKATDLTSGENASAIKISTERTSDMTPINTKAVYIELNDLESIISALTYFSREVNQPKPETNAYYSFITSNDVAFTCSYSYSGFGFWNIEIGRIYPKLRTPVAASTYSFSKRRIDELIKLMSFLKQASIAKND